MKFAKLLHNPAAGEGEHSKEDLISLIESAGFDCSYSSTKKKGWEKIESKQTDFLILAGGDGTVRKVAHELLDKKLLDKKHPIALLPMGTANNIAKTLGISGSTEDIINSWCYCERKKYDIGRIFGLKNSKFFLEGFGYGIFPLLMDEMEKKDESLKDTPEKSIKLALQVLVEIIAKADAKFCRLVVDGIDYSGKFLLVEVMNIRSIGPNLHLAPIADPGDGEFEVVFIGEDQREALMTYVQNKINGIDTPSLFPSIKAKNLQIFSEDTKVHVDDVNIEMEQAVEIKIELLPGLLEFLIAPNKTVPVSKYA